MLSWDEYRRLYGGASLVTERPGSPTGGVAQ
jgi:hypothetical protein